MIPPARDRPIRLTLRAGKRLPGGGELAADLTVRIHRQDGAFLVTSDIDWLIGEGDLPTEALDAFLRRLSSHLAWLEREESRLEPGMAEELATLRRYVSWAPTARRRKP